MLHRIDYCPFFWLTPVLVIAAVVGRALWVFRGSGDWPTADGTITSLNVLREQDPGGGGHYFSATFTYEFHDPEGRRRTGTWYKTFSNEAAARDFAAREMPTGKQVVVRINPRKPDIHELELDSFAYTDDRPTSLNL